MKPCVLNQLNVINFHCLVIAYTTVSAVVCLNRVLVSCHTYIMEKCHKKLVQFVSVQFVFVQFVSITIILSLIVRKIIEVKVFVVQF